MAFEVFQPVQTVYVSLGTGGYWRVTRIDLRFKD